MRKYVVLTGIAALILTAAVVWRGVLPASDVAAPVLTEIAVPAATVPTDETPSSMPTSDPSTSVLETAAASETTVASETAAASEPAVVAASPPPKATTLPKLPTRDVAMRPAHVVPENDPILPARPIDIQKSPSLTAETVPPHIAPRTPTRVAAVQIAGAAEVSDATALRVAGRPLVLFGVRPPGSGDRCLAAGGLNLGTPPPCLQKAQDMLIARLARNPSVSCRVPAPGAAPAAICLDADGVDLGGFLVAEGLALADPAQSYDYIGAETIARSQRRGLWRFH
jgi:endonuclease YncB( thermonuclease family)